MIPRGQKRRYLILYCVQQGFFRMASLIMIFKHHILCKRLWSPDVSFSRRVRPPVFFCLGRRVISWRLSSPVRRCRAR